MTSDGAPKPAGLQQRAPNEHWKLPNPCTESLRGQPWTDGASLIRQASLQILGVRERTNETMQETDTTSTSKTCGKAGILL